MVIKGIKIESDDHVVTLAGAADPEDTVEYRIGGETFTLRPAESIPVYHKMACTDIQKGQVVYKYGQPIGTATEDIRKGEWLTDQMEAFDIRPEWFPRVNASMPYSSGVTLRPSSAAFCRMMR